MTPEALCIEGCGRPQKKGYRGWCKPCGDESLNDHLDSFQEATTKVEIGQRFGRLVVIARGEDYIYEGYHKNKTETPYQHLEARWLCRCDCGNERVVVEGNLRTKTTRSCGCFQRDRVVETHQQDLVGMRFNRLTVLQPLGRGFWLCRCDCGNETRVYSTKLKKGLTKSCGCHRTEISADRIRRWNASRQQG